MTTRSPGTRFGPYELVAPLGTGGMGEVWEAVLHGPGGFRKAVALKLLREGPSDPALGKALVREARLGALLQHPNVVGTLGLGEYQGTWCIALELVRGASVLQIWRQARGRLPPGVVLDIGVQAAAALAHVHELTADGVGLGLVHRDVKPGNLLVDRTGLVKLADYGISISREYTTSAAGTAGYMPPEQLAGRAESRSDCFALGVVLFRLATGGRPFGSGPDAVDPVANVEAMLASPDFLEPVEEAVPGLAAVLTTCLRADPGDRPTARALRDALAALRAQQPSGPTLLELLARTAPGVSLDPHTPSADQPTRLLPTGNLPPPRDRFVGREAELADLVETLSAGPERFVVLLGPGGTGKTRLALEVARRLTGQFPGGAFAFDLSDARTEAEVCGAVARVLGIPLEQRDPAGQLGRILAAKGRTLLVLDNLEQCVDALPPTLGQWLDDAPDATFLGTSRVAPGLRGEHPKGLPELSLDDAVTLFRLRAPVPLRDHDAEAVVALCRSLEGMPLAIELAAARLRVMALADMSRRLGLALLSGGGRALPARQRSLAASLRWSWDLLTPAARAALGQVSVFEGGFRLESADAVVQLPDGGWALDALQELVDASLARVDASSGRFRLHLVVREFASQAAPKPELNAAEQRYIEHFARFGEPEALDALTRPGGVARTWALADELDNVVGACRRATARGDADPALLCLAAASAILLLRGPLARGAELASCVLALLLGPEPKTDALLWLARFEIELGKSAEAGAHCDQALATLRGPGGGRNEGRAHKYLGHASAGQGRPEEARAHYEAALRALREIGDRKEESSVRNGFGVLCMTTGRLLEARTHYEAALTINREVGCRRSEGIVLGNLGSLSHLEGEMSVARSHYEAALVIHRETGDRLAEVSVHENLGGLHFLQGRLDEARAHAEAALAYHRAAGNDSFVGHSLTNLGQVCLLQGQVEDARAHCEAALAIHRAMGNRLNARRALLTLGEIAALHGRSSTARLHFEEALALARAVGDRQGEGLTLGSRGRLHRNEGELDLARACVTDGERLLRAVSALGDLAVLLCERARLDRLEGRTEAASLALAEAEAIADRVGAGPDSELGRELTASRAELLAPR